MTEQTQAPAPKKQAAKPKRKPGRPKGAKTRNDPIVPEQPSACKKCGSTSRTQKRQRKTHYHAGGGYYRKTTWSAVVCNDCGQHYTVRTKLKQRQPFKQ